MSMCRVFSCLVGRGCLLWPVYSLGKSLLAFALLHSVLQGQICLSLQVFLDFLLCIPVPHSEKDNFFWVLVLKGLVGLHRTIQLQLLQHYWLRHRLGLPWYWMVCLGNEQRSFCRFWDCIWVLFLLWLSPFILSGIISPLISSSILDTYWHFAFSYCSWASQGKNTEVVCHSLLQWTTFCQTSPLWPLHPLGWPHMAWLSFTELDKAGCPCDQIG